MTFFKFRIDLDELVENGKIVYMKNGRKFESLPSAVKLSGKFITIFLVKWSTLSLIDSI